MKRFTLSKDIYSNIGRLKDIMNHSFDIKVRDFKIGLSNKRAAILYIENLAQEDMILDHILKPLMYESTPLLKQTGEVDFQKIKDCLVTIGSVDAVKTFDRIVLGIMSGDTFLSIEGSKEGLLINVREYHGKQFSTPSMEPSVKGPQEAFIETLKQNIGLIHKRLRDPNLVFESYQLGRRTKQDAVLAFIKDIADPDIVDEVRRRVDAIDVDGLESATQIGLLMSEKPNSIFPLVQTTERPSRLVSALLAGRVAVLLNGSPDAILLPTTLPTLLQSVDDYLENWIAASVIRISRYVALFISALFPALYIAITSFHPGMLPTNLVLSITATRTGVPFPAFVEAILMELALELPQEAGIRLLRVVGQTVSIVGGLVIGQAAVQAGVVSPIMVIIISITAVASYTIPDYSLSLATRIVRIPFMVLGVTLGTFGIVMGMLLLLTYLSSLKSVGVRYLSPISPYRLGDWKDTFIRVHLTYMKKRPELLNPQDIHRQNTPTGKENSPNEN
ncbi:MAG: spore germination protein [Clostridia bacterium]